MAGVSDPPTVAYGRPFTVEDLETMPDDGRRYGLIDGVLLVSPAPNWPHQEMGLQLWRVLQACAPRELRVPAAPFAVSVTPARLLEGLRP
jgi:hypothetical protein